DAVAVNDSVGDHVRSLIARESTPEIRDLPPQRWSPKAPATLVHLVFPNSILIYHPDYISHLGLFPAAADETLFVHTMLIPEAPADDKAAAHWQRSFELIDAGVFDKEDLVVCESIQRGLASGANDAMIVGRLEQNLQRFHSTVGAAVRQKHATIRDPWARVAACVWSVFAMRMRPRSARSSTAASSICRDGPRRAGSACAMPSPTRRCPRSPPRPRAPRP